MAEEGDRRPLALLYAAVAEERDGIAPEPPVDLGRREARTDLERTLVAVSGDDIVGFLSVVESPFGYGELGMMVAREWRGRGVGSALRAAANRLGARTQPAQARAERLPAQRSRDALYRTFGFVEEGRRIRHMRRASGELWDLIDMGLLL